MEYNHCCKYVKIMEEIMELMRKYMDKHNVDICIRFYEDESGVATWEHIEKCTDPYFEFRTIKELKEKLSE